MPEQPTDVPAEETTTERPTPAGAEALIAADLLVEDVSIDGMCGVY